MPGRVWEQAFEHAIDQYGFITFQDMKELGVEPALLRQWCQRKKVERVAHGVYRFPPVPVTTLDPYMLATLWTGRRGVLSHATALELHDLCDINSSKIHLTVPLAYRPRRQGGERYVIHKEALGEQDITWHEGISIVTPAVAIRQAIQTQVPRQLIRQAISRAKKLGLAKTRLLNRFARELRATA